MLRHDPEGPPLSGLTGAILAGGESRRFAGVDKAWALLGGRPLVAWLAAALRPQVDVLLVSANRNVEGYAQFGARVIPDAGGGGPLAGIAALLAATSTDWLLVVPCDAPRLPADWAAQMQQRARSTAADVVVLHDGIRAHPTFCLLRCAAVRADALAALAAGRLGLHDWQARQHRAWLQGVAPPNLNTPAELAAFAAQERMLPP